MFRQLQNIYQQETLKQQKEKKIATKLYNQVIEQNMDKKKQKQQFQKLLKKEQDDRMKLFWEKQQKIRRDNQYARREKVNRARQFNKSMVQHASLRLETPTKDSSIEYFLREKQLQLEDQRRYYALAQHYEQFRHNKKQQQKYEQIKIIKQKQKQSRQIQQQNLLHYNRHKQKHFQSQNPQIFKQLEHINNLKEQEKINLQRYFSQRGAYQLQQKVRKNQQYQSETEKILKQTYLKQLKSQLEINNSKQTYNKYREIFQQKHQINKRNKQIQIEERYRSTEKKQKDKNLLVTLKQQVKVQRIDDSPLQYAGIGSPVHIGKLTNDDRKKQMYWLQQDLYHSLNNAK